MVFQNKDYNVLIIISFFAVVAMVFWWFVNDLPVGTFYFGLTIFAIIGLVFTTTLINENKKTGVLQGFKFPISLSTLTASVMLILGTLIFIVLSIFTGIFSSFSITDFIVPLSAQETTVLIQQTASQLSISANLSFQFINTAFIAAILEEVVFGWLAPMFIYIILKKTSIEIFNVKANKNALLFLSFIITGIFFASLHTLNSTYGTFVFSDFATWQPYIIATIFRIMMSGLIYYAPGFLMTTIGFHIANNISWFIANKGFGTTVEALIGFPGFFILIFYGLAIITIINDLKKSNNIVVMFFKEIGRVRNDR